MREALEQLIRQIAEHPEAVSVHQTEVSSLTVFEVSVHPQDMRHVIGSQGETARALRRIGIAWGGKQRQNVHVEIVSAGARG